MPDPEPRTVWMVRPGHPDAVRGELALTADALTFAPQDAAPIRTPVPDILRARRRPGAPILEVRHRGEEGAAVAFFYFAEPPPLEGSGPGGPGVGSMFLPSRGVRRTAGIRGLQIAARRHREEIRAWVAAIRELL